MIMGDRLKTIRIYTSEVRIGCRIISYQVKILMRFVYCNSIFCLEIIVIF
ncbi:MAG: hypothetical protein QXY45_01440 [Candidatus Aenigmatarchaeota archaeon]